MLRQALQKLNIKTNGSIHRNFSVDELVKKSVARGEGIISKIGALTVKTGKYTGRSPFDRFIVDNPEVHDKMNWGKVNMPIEEDKFDKLYQKVTEHLSSKDELFVFDGYVGADHDYRLNTRVITEQASHSLFARHVLRRPNFEELKSFEPALTVISAPGCLAEPKEDGVNSEAFILVNIPKKLVIIGGTSYAGEIKKSIFTFMNYFLPEKGVFPMHCSANIGADDDDTALFFGLSGTGKTTLSADPKRRLIGDDEHGWSENGIFNFEGGCYAKCINLKEKTEPQIFAAIKPGTLVENVVMNSKTLEYDYTDGSLTENTRAAYPLEYIPGAVPSGRGGHPKTVIFLTADAFGVMPPIARLNHTQAMYHFMSGYTSKLAGTERGIVEPRAAFSTCFGEPFMPLHSIVYAKLLKKYISEYKSQVFLINTGWSGGPYGVGQRINLPYTRAMVTAALEGKLDNVEYRLDETFNLEVPKTCPEVPSEILDPASIWENKTAYHKKAQELAELFVKNFKKFENTPKEIVEACPRV